MPTQCSTATTGVSCLVFEIRPRDKQRTDDGPTTGPAGEANDAPLTLL